MGALLLPSDCFTRFGNPAWPGGRTANFAAFGAWPWVLPKNAESLRAVSYTHLASLVEEVRIGENRGIYVEKDSEHSIVWGNPDTEQVFTMVSNGLKKLDMEKAAEKISAK